MPPKGGCRLLPPSRTHPRTPIGRAPGLLPGGLETQPAFSLGPRTPFTLGSSKLIAHSRVNRSGLPRWLSGKEPVHQRRRRRFSPWVGKIPWRRAWRIPWTEEPGGLQSTGVAQSQTRLSAHTHGHSHRSAALPLRSEASWYWLRVTAEQAHSRWAGRCWVEASPDPGPARGPRPRRPWAQADLA